jgi:hypothetical protein
MIIRSKMILLLAAGAAAAAAFLTPCLAEEDAGLERLQTQFRQQRQAQRLSALAAYADQLRTLRASLAASGDSAGVAQVSQELASLMKKLESALPGTTDGAASSEGGAKNPAQQSDNLDAIFGESATAPEGSAEKSKDAPGPRRSRYFFPARLAANVTPTTYSRKHWNHAGARLEWKLTDSPPPGEYILRLRYSAPKGASGGSCTLTISGNGKPVSFDIASESSDWNNVTAKDVASLRIEELPVTLAIEATALAEGAEALFDLRVMELVPAESQQNAASKRPTAQPSPESAETVKRKDKVKDKANPAAPRPNPEGQAKPPADGKKRVEF